MRYVYFGVAVAVAWATVSVGINQPKTHPVQWIALLLVGATAAVQIYSALIAALGPTLPQRRRHAENILRNRLAKIHESGYIEDDFTLVSMHVWMVPASYRWVFPYRLRAMLRSLINERVSDRRSIKPSLKLVGFFGLKDRATSGVKFYKGYGLVGKCLAVNDPSKPLYVDFNEPVVRAALDEGPSTWENQSPTVTRGLSFDDAKKIASRYDQAMAHVVFNPESSEALGVVTLEVRRGFKGILKDNPELVDHVSEVANVLAPVLAIRGELE